MSHAAERINKLAKQYQAKNYLEIGSKKGNTFCAVEMPHKTAVNVKFSFDTAAYTQPTVQFFKLTSSDFFKQFLPPYSNSAFILPDEANFYFDIIFIDGLHTFEQSYRDFENTLPHSHDNTIWILDDTIPSDPYSAYPNQVKSYEYRSLAGIAGTPWHGDVYKTVLAIHDLHPEISYCTQIDKGNPQTILWKAPSQTRSAMFSSLSEIDKFSYFDLLDNAYILIPVKDSLMYEMVGLTLNPLDYKTGTEFQKIITALK